MQSLRLQQEYLDSGISDCNAFNTILESNIDELAKKMATIIEYEKAAIFNQEEFNLQLRDYFLTEIQFFLIAQEIDQKCEKDNVKIIYFYDESADDKQGKILDYLKYRFKNDILVFSFNSAFKEEPMIAILLESYNISTYPSVVIEDTVFQGHTDLKTLKAAICQEFDSLETQPKDCE